MKKLHISKAFLGADAINSTKWFMTTDERTAGMNEIVLADADTSIVLADSSKFDKASFVSYANPEIVYEVITDWNLSDETKNSYELKGYNIKIIEKTIGV